MSSGEEESGDDSDSRSSPSSPSSGAKRAAEEKNVKGKGSALSVAGTPRSVLRKNTMTPRADSSSHQLVLGGGCARRPPTAFRASSIR